MPILGSYSTESGTVDSGFKKPIVEAIKRKQSKPKKGVVSSSKPTKTGL